MVLDKYELFRRWVSPFINGRNADAILDTLADDQERGDQLNISVNDQMTISTASGIYLYKRLSEIGIQVPPEIGISDDAARQLGIITNATKLVPGVIHDVLEIFYGPEAVRAVAQSTIAETYALADGMDLSLVLEDNTERTITFLADDFADISNATAAEVSGAITQKLRQQGVPNALSLQFLDLNTNQTYVRIFGAAKGPFSLVKVTGGQAQAIMRFGEFRNTNLTSNTTVWQVTKNFGQTLRFRWDGGPSPKLGEVKVGDRVLIYGQQFGIADPNLQGTFEVTAVRVPKAMASYDAGWFEITVPNENVLKFSQPDVAPPANGGGNIFSYVISQSQFSDLMFFFATKNTSYSKPRYAVAFEPARKLLRIYMPATTKVVQRDLIGGSYMHMLFPDTDLDGTFGSASDDSQKVEIISDNAVRYPQDRLDNLGEGGTLTYGMTSVPIDRAWRESGFATVVTTTPHGLVGDDAWTTSVNYAPGDVVYRTGGGYVALQASGPGFGGARDPQIFPVYWNRTGAMRNLTSTVIDVEVTNVMADDPNNTFLGPYMADLEEQFTLTSKIVTLRERILAGDTKRTLTVLGTLPAAPGFLILDLAKDGQEHPIPYITSQVQGAPVPVAISTISQNGTTIVVTTSAPHGAIPQDTVTIAGTTGMNGTYPVSAVPGSNVMELTSGTSQVAYDTTGTSVLVAPGTISTLIVDPTYQFEFAHDIGADATLLSSTQAYQPAVDGSDYSFFITSDAEARVYAETVIKQIVALGINLQVVVVYPDDAGLGNWGDSQDENVIPHSEAVYVWGV